MSKVAVVYWSGTGNTEIMANKVAEGAKAGGAEVEVFEAEGFSADKMDEFDAVAFGCPSMGCEELEDTIFEPMFASCESKLQGKKIALFGSYGWGDVRRLQIQPERQTCRPVRLLRLGRRRVDAQLGARLPQLRYPARVRQRDLQRNTG